MPGHKGSGTPFKSVRRQRNDNPRPTPLGAASPGGGCSSSDGLQTPPAWLETSSKALMAAALWRLHPGWVDTRPNVHTWLWLTAQADTTVLASLTLLPLILLPLSAVPHSESLIPALLIRVAAIRGSPPVPPSGPLVDPPRLKASVEAGNKASGVVQMGREGLVDIFPTKFKECCLRLPWYCLPMHGIWVQSLVWDDPTC